MYSIDPSRSRSLSARSTTEFDRRAFLAAAGAATAATPVLAQTGAPVGFADAHAHFFNAADLPIAGFTKYTLLPSWIGESIATAALIDFLVNFVGLGAIGATAERAVLGGAPIKEWTADRFGSEGSTFIEGRRGARAVDKSLLSVSTSAELRTSYDALVAALMLDANYSSETVLKSFSEPSADSTFRLTTNNFALTDIARKAESAPAGYAPGDLVIQREPILKSTMGLPVVISGAGAIARTIGWGYLMLKSRRSHLRQYLANNSAPGYAPTLLLNHLVDYDYWLDDRPRIDSGHESQIAFFSRLAAMTAAIDLRTFAGFCPLKLAVQTAAGKPLWFDQLRQHFGSGTIAGFKLYPPMGFRPIRNRELPDSAFDSGGIARVSALDKWRDAGGQVSLGTALDSALEQFYTWCASRSVPIMAHARRSNGAADNYELRANPALWEEVAARYPLRLMLGHLIDDAETFVGSGDGSPADASWPLAATARMLQGTSPGNQSKIYGDLGYMPELVRRPSLAKAFFEKLRRVLGVSGLKQVCYGTDWIMFAREPHNGEYLRNVARAMEAAGYTPEERADILENNARRFLGR